MIQIFNLNFLRHTNHLLLLQNHIKEILFMIFIVYLFIFVEFKLFFIFLNKFVKGRIVGNSCNNGFLSRAYNYAKILINFKSFSCR